MLYNFHEAERKERCTMAEKLKAVILDGHTENPGDLSWDWLKENFELTVYPRTPADKIIERSKDADMIILNKIPITRETLAQLPKLKFIAVLATGYNQLDCAALKERGIPVSNIPAYSTDGVAQMTFSFILECMNRVADYTADVKNLGWAKCEDFSYRIHPLHELAGRTLGIIGFGKIGARVAEIANVFGMKILAYTPSGKKEGYPHVQFTSLDDLTANADFITVHCPLTPDTAQLVNAAFIGKMKKGACIINTARGGIINEADVAAALKSGALAGYGTDVLSTEPPKKDNPLLNAPNCYITPHIAWAGYETRVRLMEILKENVDAFLAGKPINVVNG